MLSEKELAELGRRLLQQREKDKARTKITAAAVKRLIAAHRPEYVGYLNEEAAISS